MSNNSSICAQIDNFNNSLDYFYAMKNLSDDLTKYMRTYRQLISEFLKKMNNMQSSFSKKLTKSDNPKLSLMISLTSKLIYLIDENLGLYKLSFDELETNIKTFEQEIKIKNDSIKSLQKKSLEQNKIIVNIYTEINKAKKNYLDSISKTEEIIQKYYLNKKILEEHELGLAKKLNNNEYNTLKEKLKSELNDMNNSIKSSKNYEKIYQDIIKSSKEGHENFEKSYQNFNDTLKKNNLELFEKIKNLLINFYDSYTNCYKQPLAINNLTSLKELIIEKETEKIISEYYKEDICIDCNLCPVNYKLKSFSILNESNYLNNKQNEDEDINNNLIDEEYLRNLSNERYQRRESVLVLEDGFSQLQYISDSSLFNTIKTIFDNFTIIEKDEINLDTEEIKFKTQELIYKIESNMNSYPYGKFGIKKTDENKKLEYNRNELTDEEIEQLAKLLKQHESRIVFLQKLSDYRSKGKYFLEEKDYNLLLKYFNIIADTVLSDADYHSGELIIILSQTYLLDSIENKKYLQQDLMKNKLYKDRNFWEDFLCYAINKEIMKTQKRDKKIIEDKEISDNKLSNVVFSQLLTLIDNMAEFGVDAQSIKEVIEPKIVYYKLNDALKNTINDVLNSKIEKEKKENNKNNNNISDNNNFENKNNNEDIKDKNTLNNENEDIGNDKDDKVKNKLEEENKNNAIKEENKEDINNEGNKK